MPVMRDNVEFDFALDYEPSALPPFSVGDFVPSPAVDSFGVHAFRGEAFVVAEKMANRNILDVRRLFVKVFPGVAAARDTRAAA